MSTLEGSPSGGPLGALEGRLSVRPLFRLKDLAPLRLVFRFSSIFFGLLPYKRLKKNYYIMLSYKGLEEPEQLGVL